MKNMNKNKLIKWIIILLMLIILVIIILLAIIKNTDFSNLPDPPTSDPAEMVVNRNVKQVTVTNNYFMVKEIIDNYYNYCKDLNTTKDDIETYKLQLSGQELQNFVQDGIKEKKEFANNAIYNMLDETYMQEFNITQDSIEKNFAIQYNPEIVIKNMYEISNSINVNTYFVSGIYCDISNKKSNSFYLAVTLDMLNNTFKIYPEEYLKKHECNNVKVGDTLEINIESVANKNYNTFEYEIKNVEDICKEYFYNFKYSALCDTEYSYEMLDNEYKELKFGSVDKYKEYIKSHIDKIEIMNFNKYNTYDNDKYTQYVYVDRNEKFYIINASSITDYKVFLDNYTIDNPQFLEKYNSANTVQRVGYNIQKCLDAINDADYTYVYNKLDSQFKNNSYPTEKDFTNSIKSKLFETNKVSSVSSSNEGNIYVYKMVIEDKNDQTKKQNLTVIMKLLEGTDFTMSFSFE